MAIRNVLHELEARLSPPAGDGGPSSGKLEFKRYGDGRHRMKITCRKLDVPDGAALELRCGDRVIAVLVAQSGRTKLDEERPASEEAPPLAAGEEVTLRHEGVALLSGWLSVD